MRHNSWISCLVAALLAAFSVQASTAVEQLQLPQCLAKKLTVDYTTLAENNQFKIISLAADDIKQVVLTADNAHCGRFVNITHLLQGKSASIRTGAAETLLRQPLKKTTLQPPVYAINHPTLVYPALAAVDEKEILKTLSNLVAFKNRSATKPSGRLAAQWLKDRFESMVLQSQRTDTATWYVQTGPNYIQPSLVTVIGQDIKAPAIVLGAHMDTLDGFMPGAGDDGSGSASLMEMARVLLNSQLTFQRPIYFIWYAAEERGLVGSQYVVKDFIAKSIPVQAVAQFDMTGFRNDRRDPTMWLFRDFTDDHLTDYLIRLIETYIGVPTGESKCLYGCSDHASWTKVGVPAAFPCETDYEHHNKTIHTSKDTMARLTPEHMVNFTKLGLAMAIELASE